LEENNNKKKRTVYHLMLFIDKADGGINQMGIGSWFIELVAGIIAALLILTIVGWSVNSHLRKDYKEQNAILTSQVESLTAQVDELTKENSDLSSKVTILSDTVNTKVEQETAAQEETDAAHYPEGFPLSASASMSTDADQPNTIIFSCNEGSSIISTGAGTVLEVVPDADYGYCIRIDHGNGYISEYKNASTPLIKEGDEVLQGAILSVVEGKDSKLIYKIYKDDKEIDPMTVIKIDG